MPKIVGVGLLIIIRLWLFCLDSLVLCMHQIEIVMFMETTNQTTRLFSKYKQRSLDTPVQKAAPNAYLTSSVKLIFVFQQVTQISRFSIKNYREYFGRVGLRFGIEKSIYQPITIYHQCKQLLYITKHSSIILMFLKLKLFQFI